MPELADPEFTVVLTTHNRPDFLAEAIESVLQQSIGDFELIVVDDASELPAITPVDERIQLVRLDQNIGVAGARNVGIDRARGRAITFLDDDDVFTPQRLDLARRGLKRAPVTVCWTKYLGEPVRRNRTLEGNVADAVLDDLTPPMGATTIRRDSIMRFDEQWEAVEELDWWLRAAQQFDVATIPELGLEVRRHDRERWRNDVRTRIRENQRLVGECPEYFDAHPRAASFRMKRVGLLALQMGDYQQARTAFVRSLRRNPRLRTAWHLLRALRPTVHPADHDVAR